jgi:hypothetical protein
VQDWEDAKKLKAVLAGDYPPYGPLRFEDPAAAQRVLVQNLSTNLPARTKESVEAVRRSLQGLAAVRTWDEPTQNVMFQLLGQPGHEHADEVYSAWAIYLLRLPEVDDEFGRRLASCAEEALARGIPAAALFAMVVFERTQHQSPLVEEAVKQLAIDLHEIDPWPWGMHRDIGARSELRRDLAFELAPEIAADALLQSFEKHPAKVAAALSFDDRQRVGAVLAMKRVLTPKRLRPLERWLGTTAHRSAYRILMNWGDRGQVRNAMTIGAQLHQR